MKMFLSSFATASLVALSAFAAKPAQIQDMNLVSESGSTAAAEGGGYHHYHHGHHHHHHHGWHHWSGAERTQGQFPTPTLNK